MERHMAETEQEYRARVNMRNEAAMDNIANILRRPEWPGAEALEWIADIVRGAGYDLRNGMDDEGNHIVDGQIRNSWVVTVSTRVRVDARDEDQAGAQAEAEIRRLDAGAFEWEVEEVEEDR